MSSLCGVFFFPGFPILGKTQNGPIQALLELGSFEKKKLFEKIDDIK